MMLMCLLLVGDIFTILEEIDCKFRWMSKVSSHFTGWYEIDGGRVGIVENRKRESFIQFSPTKNKNN